MGLSVKGFLLEPPRIGQSNSPYTYTPNVYVSNPSAFNTAYPSDESVPRTEYCVLVLNDSGTPGTGPNNNSSFVEVKFAWTKNEVLQRFDYSGVDGRFKALPGAVPTAVGTLTASANTTRLKVDAPINSNLTAYPVRLFLGTVGSGNAFIVSTVLTDADFGSPVSGTVQVSMATGDLNWNTADLTTFAGQPVFFQRQTFYSFDASKGNIGVIDNTLLLNPLPATGQFPLIRIGYGSYLIPVQVASDGAFSGNPASGHVEWSVATGRLKFNSVDIAANTARSVYYDGVAFTFNQSLPTTSLGTVASPASLSPVPPEGSDTFFRVPGVVQFQQTQFVDAVTSPGKKGVVQIRRSNGFVQFSNADIGQYGAQTAQAITADLIIERGISLRMFRNPVNLDDSDPTLKDVSAFYVSQGAIWAQPIIASPTVVLPAIPVDTDTLNVNVEQGTGSFVGPLPRLDVAVPPVGLGYVLDYDNKQLIYAQRKDNVVIPAPTPYGGVQLADPLVFAAGLKLELETAPNSGLYSTLTVGTDALFDAGSGLVTMVSTDGSKVVTGVVGAISGASFTDATQNFSTAGVAPGDFLIIQGGPAKGVYTIVSVGTTTLVLDAVGATSSGFSYEVVSGVEILADRYFREVPPVDPNTKVERIRALGTIENSPRLSIDPNQASFYRFRYGVSTFSTTTTLVSNDAGFTASGSLPSGTVEVSLATGHLNFSQVDVTAGGAVFGSRALVLGVGYTLQAPLGFIQFSDRFLELEEAQITYKDANGDLISERATFLVRKELTQDHPTPTAVLSFNPNAREVAANPSPKAYRGGRPQTSAQVTFDTTASTVTFFGAATATDALPSGPVVNPNENVYVDYYIYQAMGGEQNLTVLQPPIQTIPIIVNSDTNQFTLVGDRTSDFAANHLLLVDRTETYLIGSSAYVSGTGLTTVTLSSLQLFRSDFQNPVLAVTSGVTPLTGSTAFPAYFTTEITAYAPISRGSAKMLMSGDVSKTYVSGMIVEITDGATFLDFNLVAGSTYDAKAQKTTITFIANGARQYSGVNLKRSVRPILATALVKVQTKRSPELGQVYTVFRKIDGQSGKVLSSPADYTIDASGSVAVVSALGLNEEIGIFYTGDLIVDAGRSLRASYTFTIVPTEQNGLLNQTLKADYTTYAPDTFFWRVETFTNFRGELAQQYESDAQSSTPSGGPILQNSSSPKLFEQGRESVFFQEGHLSNEDLVARPTLKYYNDSVNALEDALQYFDGRVVGDHDGRFLFDGNIDNPYRATFAAVTNQIDDNFKISPAPYTVTGPPFVVTSVGTFQEVYKAAPTSRFYPTQRVMFGATVPTVGLKTGDPILDTGTKSLKAVPLIQRRFPWAVTTQLARAGSTVLTVDAATGSTDLLRPSFANTMKVAITAQDGAVLVADSPGMTVSGFSATTITLTAGVGVSIPIGATVRLSTADTTYLKQYRLGIDIGVDLDAGLLTYQAPSAPWNDPLVPTPLQPAPPNSGGGEVLDVTATIVNTLTAPDRFPALDGGTEDDDNNRQFQILNPDVVSEDGLTGYITTEFNVINASTGTLRVHTTPTFVGTGSLDGTKTIITNSVTWPSPSPQIGDLVEIRTGLNALSGYHRITANTSNTTTVTPAFASVDSGFSFTVTVSNDLVQSTGDVSTTTTLTDSAADYVALGVVPGQTIVITSGTLSGLRRQVTAVVSTHVLAVTAFPSTATAQGYRLVNSLGTFGGVSESIVVAELVPAISGEGVVVANQTASIDSFFNTAMATLVTATNGVSATSTFTSAGQTFITAGITTADLLFIRNGAAAGVYKVQQVLSQTSLLIEGTFPTNTTGITFQIVATVGLTAEPLQGILSTALASSIFYATLSPFLNLVTVLAPVVGDAGAYAVRLLTTDLNAREAVVTARRTAITSATGYVASLEAELSSGDRLYDRRYVWLDARINLTNGILAKKDIARVNRIKAQADILNQLTKLLSVQT